jgi:hypothetical protein
MSNKPLKEQIELFKEEFGENFSKLNDMVTENVTLLEIIEAVETTPNDFLLGTKVRLIINKKNNV